MPSDPQTPGPPVPEPAPAWRQLALIFAARTTLNTAHRIVYPFLPALARGLNLSLAAASSLVTVRFLAGLAAPFLGPWIDRRPRRHTMELALGLFVLAGLLLAAGSRWVAAAVAAFALFGLSKVLYDPAVHAYVGDTVPYHRRGRVIGVVEFSWSSAWLLGVPAAGLLIERYGWQAPWLVMAVLGLLALGLTHAGVPPVRPAAGEDQGRRPAGAKAHRLLQQWRDLLRRPRVLALLLTSLLLTMASELPLIVYGAWLEETFGLGLSTLGLASLVIGLAEASAELSTTVLTDRLGKKRSVLAGLLGLGASLVVLPLLAGTGLAGALAGVVLMTVSFEFAIVSLLPLATELAPGARGSLLSLNMTTFSLGRIAGATAGGWLWQWSGGTIAANALVGAACALLAALVVSAGWSEL